MKPKTYRQWLLKKRPDGIFSVDDFEVRAVSTPDLASDEVLIKTLYLSFDPTQRGWAAIDTYMPAVALGETMRAMGIGQVVESKNTKFKTGDLVAGLLNWQEYAHLNPRQEKLIPLSTIPAFLEPELALAFMLTGLTAYFGLLELGKPKAGETVVVSAAAGATGSIVAQIAKIKGARVIGIAGGAHKCAWLIETLGVDEAIDYKNENVEKRLAELCDKKIDVYFDNVGGEILDAVLQHLAVDARIVICGAISQYNKMAPDADPADSYGVKGIPNLIVARATVQGFLVTGYMDRALEGLAMLNHWHGQGRLTQAIDRQEGFENIPKTLIRLFAGKNTGKQILKLADAPLPLNKNEFMRIGFQIASRFIAWRKG